MSKTVKIVGLDKFTRNVLQQKGKMEQAIHQEVVRSGMRVEKRAKQLAPFDTGWLSNTIYSFESGRLRTNVVSPAEYSIYVEEGTRYMAAQPFLFPAVKEEFPRFMKNMRKIARG
ncbi:HK97 gp10 family phage protein [Enterococcus hulanensis]|uniref:HK97 gp10 family phage protein n=1 Tax=Enterococcus hulanensis TaxID=2559929 RepID=A0ABU3F258_9ENTE|nr:HK97-gp10 family putative phage morphogenesis protein [Enterococcus hulanensis]MDT2600992.1 HK97 gp10 family phage protein [Enterococcus hulanensis]MDT2610526.1 HK97 gp10 family phage protein [Enterococcus hulanensis]MDT2617253.1 HK97 gp10 family phage protein [Enterococcus hulanensis]